MCKILVEIIWCGEINSFLVVISFQLNSTDTFTIPINNDVVIFKCIYYMVSIWFQIFGAKVINNKIGCCWLCKMMKNSWCVSCGVITVISKHFLSFM